MNATRSYYLGTAGVIAEPYAGTAQARDLDIRVRAHQLWEEDDCCHGNDWAHWFQAEQEFYEMVGGDW
jgi:hypothetical protein